MQVRRRAPLSLKRPLAVLWAVAAGVAIADQITKALVRVVWADPHLDYPIDRILGRGVEPRFAPGESLAVFGDWLHFTYVRNTGAAFGLLPGYRPFFVATTLIVLTVVVLYWRRSRPSRPLVVVALGLIAAGGIGNLVDRVVLGSVTDFIDVAAIDFPVFNIADSALFVGVGMLIGWLMFGPEAAAAGPETTTAEKTES